MVYLISANVGPGQANHQSDVKTVQGLLKRSLLGLTQVGRLATDGICGRETVAAIELFQARVVRLRPPDGIVGPNGPTMRHLVSHAATPVAPQAGLPPTSGSLETAYLEAARCLACEVAAIKAVAQTETKRSAFDVEGRPTILFERHIFSKRTEGAYDAKYPDISNKIAGGYGKYAEQYARLERAMKLDRTAALESASWGAFQIMGFNHANAGYPGSVDSFVEAMKVSEYNHLAAFVAIVSHNGRLLRSIRKKDWTTFARHYNGSNYADNQYDIKMKINYEQLRRDEAKITDRFSKSGASA